MSNIEHLKKFNYLMDGIKFRTHCPLCKDGLYVHENGLSESYFFDGPEPQISFSIFNSDDTRVYINPLNNDTKLEVLNGSLKKLVGTFGCPVRIECNSCNMYSFVLQVWISLSKQQVIEILLNSESIGWEDQNNILHEIVSSYTMNRTTYSYFGSDHSSSDDGQITIPLIPIDVDNPGNTVARIQRLILFS